MGGGEVACNKMRLLCSVKEIVDAVVATSLYYCYERNLLFVFLEMLQSINIGKAIT